MKEFAKTLGFCLAAALIAGAAVMIDPGERTPEALSDQGQPFYPQFTDPQGARVIEVIDYDEGTATARPLKVQFKENQWVIPSHHGYPADAEQRLAATAGALMELRKDIVVSDRLEDHATYGVVDPLDSSAASLTGRGKRVTLKAADDAVLAEFVVGKVVEGKAGYRYLRVPGQKRTYAVKTDADVSARFQDWIETDLLKLEVADIRRVSINSYSINEQFGILENVETTVLTRENDRWTASRGSVPSKEKMDRLLGALDNLRIVDVQPKPLGLSRDLKTPEGIRLSPESITSLRQKGFFVTQMGQLLSNEGEVLIETEKGVHYTLRFGEVASSQSDGEQRYVFITADSPELRNRFADWYYIISAVDFAALRGQTPTKAVTSEIYEKKEPEKRP
jgi:hypothetical protein